MKHVICLPKKYTYLKKKIINENHDDLSHRNTLKKNHDSSR